MARPRSWRDVPASNPTVGARGNFRPGGLSAWRSIVAPSGGGGGRRSANRYAEDVADRAFGEADDDFNLMNAGGKALLGALDILDTPRAAVAATINELADAGEYGGEFRIGDVIKNTRSNISTEEALGTPEGLPSFIAGGLIDPLSYVSGGAARVGVEAGKPAARAFLKPGVKNFLGEAAAASAERAGMKFADDAARTAYVREQGQKLANQAAQKALRFKSNQALSPLEREAIGALPGTYVKIPGSKRLGVDKLIEQIVPGRVLPAQHGGKAFRLTKAELGLGKLAGKTAAAFKESKFGNKTAELFTKYPDLRQKILFGTPDEAAIAFHGMEEAGAGQLQRRLTESIFGTKMADLLGRAKRAGVDGTDLRYAIAEAVEEGEEQFAGASSGAVAARAIAANDPELLTEFRQFFRDIRDYSNQIDPELPWLMQRSGYTVNLPSDEAIALRGAWNSAGGPLRRETFDFRQKYGLADDQISEFMGTKLLPPAEAGGRSVRQQIDDILAAQDAPNLFELDAYKAFPDYVRRVSKRYGDEFMAKRLRDLGIADPGWVQALTERGMSQGRAKAAIQKLQTRAAVRAEKARMAAEDARSAAIAAESNLGASEATLREVRGDLATAQQRKGRLEAAATVMDPDGVREYETLLRDQADVLAVERDDLLRSLELADADAGLLGEAQIAMANRINQETRDAFERVTSLETAIAQMEDELADLYDRMYFLNESVTPDAITARKAADEISRNEAQIAEVTGKMRAAEGILAQFEDLANLDTDIIDQQLADLGRMLDEAVEQYRADPAWASKVMVLADLKAGMIHQKSVIERARGRVAELDRSDPAAWIDEIDALKDSSAMADMVVHSIFPELPDEVTGNRLREFFLDRMPALEAEIDATRGQVMSAYADRDTMRVQLGQIRRQKHEANKNVRRVGKDIRPRMREIAEQEAVLLDAADTAASRALEIDDELRTIRDQLGIMDVAIGGIETQNKVAEFFVAQQTAKQMHYEALAATAEQASANATKVRNTWDRIAKDNLNKEQETALASALNDNFRQLGAVSMTKHDWLVDGLRSATIMQGPKALRPAFAAFDKVQNLWKAYALSSPGSVNRNLFGGVFNNWLAGDVRPEDYTKTMAWVFGGGRGLSDADKAIFQQLSDAGLLVSSGSILEVERRAAGATNFRPWSTDNKFVQTFRRGQENVESLVRGSLAYSTLRGGGDINDAIGQVVKYHFDYDDLSAFERSVLRRVVPFYTWTRKNFPLMLEQIVQNPTRFSRFYQLKTEIEQQSPEETFIPSYFEENLAMRLPFEIGGDRAYMLPDVPFMALNDLTDPSLAFSQVSPFIKTPVEYAFGKQFFKGIPLQDEYAPVPDIMTKIPGLMPLLDGAGIARRGPNGWSMKKKDMYVAEQMMPVYGRVRRLFPSEPQYNERVLASWASWALGAGLRTNTPTDRRNEAYRRIYDELESAESRYELGFADFGYTEDGRVRKPPPAYSVYDAQFGDTQP